MPFDSARRSIRATVSASSPVSARTCAVGELLDVLGTHPGEEVEPFGVERRHARQARGGVAAVRQQRRAGQRVRPAARPPDRHETVEPELVEHPRRVGGRVGHAATLAPGRAGVPRPRVGDELPAALVEGVGEQRERVGRVRGADVEDQHAPIGRPVAHDFQVNDH
jgi:hypothetical protein